jgi:hypothetical protein
MAITNKPTGFLDANQVLEQVYTSNDKTLTVSGFVSAWIGHKIQRTDTDGGSLGGAAAGDDFSYYYHDDHTSTYVLLYTIRVLYNDSGKSNFLSAERVI